MELIEINTTADKDLPLLIELYERAFPEEERRRSPALRNMIESVENMHFNKIMYEGRLAGMIIYWKFEDFAYIEHFAVFENMRGSGIGAQTIHKVLSMLGKDVILEAEVPTDEISRRRIGFYERCGFHPIDKNYVQPCYDKIGDACPLWILSVTDKSDASTSIWIDTLKNKVYRDFAGKD